ncbi:MAG: hypothetical protein PWP23_3222 [Candidatus Sumerlaeota bacterium]|nr:hypothetical protein [Candidatus Sumerlaeota bacterium]
MAIKHAKQSFTREEIVDILQRNVTLFRDDANFAEYIVELTMYLVDQAYVVGGERMRGFGDLPEAAGHAASPGSEDDPHGSSARKEAPERSHIEFDANDPDKPTNKMRLQDLEAVIKAPPPPLLAGEDELDPSTDQLRDLRRQYETAMRERELAMGVQKYEHPPEEELDHATDDPSDSDTDYTISRMERDGFEALRRSRAEADSPRTPRSLAELAKQLPSVGYITPGQPEGGLPNSEEDVRRSRPSVQKMEGRANIYRPVRPDTAARNRQWTCPVCGTDTKGSRICPSCGNIL